MCVIFACEDKFPSLKILKEAEEMNSDGAGVAWLDKQKNIHFVKGIDGLTVYKMIKSKELKLPCIIHFRIASSGGVSKALTHPFIISKESPIKLKGVLPKGSKGVLFHNGTIDNYENKLKDNIMLSQSQMLKGQLSDSRVMAFISALYGHEFIKIDSEGWNKYAVLDSKGIHRYGSWGCLSKGVMESNNYYKEDFYGNMYNDPDDMSAYGLNSRVSYGSWGKAIPQGRNDRAFESGVYPNISFKDAEKLDDDLDIMDESDKADSTSLTYDPKSIDSEIDGTLDKEQQERNNHVFELAKLFKKTQDEKHDLRNLKPYYANGKKASKKEIREMDIAFLKANGWGNSHKLESISTKKLEKFVETEQGMQRRHLESEIKKTEIKLKKAIQKRNKKFNGIDKTDKISMENYENAYTHMVVKQEKMNVLNEVVYP